MYTTIKLKPQNGGQKSAEERRNEMRQYAQSQFPGMVVTKAYTPSPSA
ncbi:hypothetical protein D9_0098 [Aeromonas phage D9]|nr:hypothetical protein D9_0098 [Aeromonas phage D9]